MHSLKLAGSQCIAVAGTYLGLVEKLPYLQALGINAIELLPIHEFNELEYYQVRRRPGSAGSAWRLRVRIPAGFASAHHRVMYTWLQPPGCTAPAQLQNLRAACAQGWGCLQS